ncbi:hypothetical protein IGI04_030352 [Brassica rapa subsp. trilocularis]|uniref:Uncharacterized protein n=1 Tax=Brassica rapa subsp. trilocularis TaxID=1813537 RepID=A0ABQ7LSU6_BRACM|nr:hypothetical protein IGI04_030352 [Brassica rapa subsp. trilocularis]
MSQKPIGELNHISYGSNELENTGNGHLIIIMIFPFWQNMPQTYLWRPEELAKVSNYVFKDYVITKYKDIMHLLLSKEPHTNFREALKHKRKNYKQEEHKQFRPPDFEQDKHQDITGFIINKEAPLDPEYKTKPSKNRF